MNGVNADRSADRLPTKRSPKATNAMSAGFVFLPNGTDTVKSLLSQREINQSSSPISSSALHGCHLLPYWRWPVDSAMELPLPLRDDLLSNSRNLSHYDRLSVEHLSSD